MSENIKEILEFPVLYTFKAMGENSDDFKCEIRNIFLSKDVDSITETPSKKGTYVSVSVTAEVESYEELQTIYTSIKNTKGLKYHL